MDRDFIDHLYQLWSKTTHADNGEWKITKDEKAVLVDIESEDKDGWEQTISFGTYEYDAEFIVTVHGALPLIVRELHAAWDEADRLDGAADARECRIAELETEVAELKTALAQELATVAELQSDLEGLIAR